MDYHPLYNNLSQAQAYSLPHPSLLQATQIQFLLTFSFQYKLWFFQSLTLITNSYNGMLFHYFPPFFSEMFQGLQSNHRLLRLGLQLRWNLFSTWNQDTTEIHPEAKQLSQARICLFLRPQHTTCLLMLLQEAEEYNWSWLWWQKTLCLNSKGSRSACQTMEICLASGSATENAFHVM